MLKLSIVVLAATPALAQPVIPWSTIDGGGGASTGGALRISGTVGQPDVASLSAGPYSLKGGFWTAFDTGSCYANCDSSTGSPLLTPNDFQCFLNRFAAIDPYANCDGSTGTPALTPNDFQCFLNAYAAGCS